MYIHMILFKARVQAIQHSHQTGLPKVSYYFLLYSSFPLVVLVKAFQGGQRFTIIIKGDNWHMEVGLARLILTPVSVVGWLEALECALGVEESAVVEPEVFTAAVLGADLLSALLD